MVLSVRIVSYLLAEYGDGGGGVRVGCIWRQTGRRRVKSGVGPNRLRLSIFTNYLLRDLSAWDPSRWGSSGEEETQWEMNMALNYRPSLADRNW